MISDDELSRLPDDPQLAFVRVEEILRNYVQTEEREWSYNNNYPGNPEEARLQYITRMLAAARVYKIQELEKWAIPNRTADDIGDAYRQFTSEIDFLTMQIRLLRKPADRSTSVGLDGNTKTKIHHYVGLIRELIEAAELTIDKRDELYKKLDKFVLEVDKARTPIESIGSVFVTVCGYVGEGFTKLQPAKELIDSISTLLGHAKGAEDSLLALTRQDPPKLLEAPPRQLPAPPKPAADLDDQIPF